MSYSNGDESNAPWWVWLIILLIFAGIFVISLHITATTTTQVIDKSQQRHKQITKDKDNTMNECIKAFPNNVKARSQCIEESQRSSGIQHNLEDISDTVLGYQAIKHLV